jgi:hypothetical protein
MLERTKKNWPTLIRLQLAGQEKKPSKRLSIRMRRIGKIKQILRDVVRRLIIIIVLYAANIGKQII